jgi:hypothetical protein
MAAMSSNVSPVGDYEPPVFGGPPVLPPVTDHRTPRLARRTAPPRPPAAESARVRDAAVFADAALRRVLEVMDRRRPRAQLRGVLAAGLVDSLPAGAAGSPAGGGPARLRRVHAQPVAAGAAEVAASYTRGPRVHAIACRIQRTGARWQLVALHLG